VFQNNVSPVGADPTGRAKHSLWSFINAQLQKMSRISYATMILLVVACSYENKVCEFQSEDLELTIYNNVLTDLIENRMHSRYLGGIEDKIFDKYDYNSQDTIKIKNEIAKAQNSIFNEPSKFCTLYLDTLKRAVHSPWFYLDTARNNYAKEMKQLISQYTENGQGAVDSLNQIQTRYSGGDFGLCTSRIKNLRDLNKNDTSECVFGRLRLSKIVLDDSKTKGMIYYDWHCGSIGLCGHGGLILFERQGNRYKIKDLLIDGVY
jgi:hypothetical protein